MRKLAVALAAIVVPFTAGAQSISVRPGTARLITANATMSYVATYADFFGAILWRNVPTASPGTDRTTELPVCNAATNGMMITVMDDGDNAAKWPIVVFGPSGTHVGGNAGGVTIDQNRGSATFMCDGVSNWSATAQTIPGFNVTAGGPTLQAAMNGGVVSYNSPSPTSVMLPSYPTGTYSVAVINYGAGTVTITPEAGRTIGTKANVQLAQNQSAVIYSADTDNAVILTGVSAPQEITIPPLNGDVLGTLTANYVQALLGRPLGGTPPQVGDVLTWDGAAWVPSAGGGPPPTPSPAITSLSPDNCTMPCAAQNVTIAGTNFTSTQGTVNFGGQTATINSWADQSISAVVPIANLNVGTISVTVTAGGKTSGGSTFEVLAAAPPGGGPGFDPAVSWTGSPTPPTYSNGNRTILFATSSPPSTWGMARTSAYGYAVGTNELRIFNMHVDALPAGNPSGGWIIGLAQSGNSTTVHLGATPNGSVSGAGNSLGIQVPYDNTTPVNNFAVYAGSGTSAGADGQATGCNKTGGSPVTARFSFGSTVWLGVNFNNGTYICSPNCTNWYGANWGGTAIRLASGATFYPAFGASPQGPPAGPVGATINLDPDLSACTTPVDLGFPSTGPWKSWTGGHQIP